MNTFVVHKHRLTSRTTKLALPLDFEILCFDKQGKEFYIWEKHNPETKSTCERTFHLVYTGEHVSFINPTKYLGTVMDQGIPGLTPTMVYHLFMEDI